MILAWLGPRFSKSPKLLVSRVSEGDCSGTRLLSSPADWGSEPCKSSVECTQRTRSFALSPLYFWRQCSRISSSVQQQRMPVKCHPTSLATSTTQTIGQVRTIPRQSYETLPCVASSFYGALVDEGRLATCQSSMPRDHAQFADIHFRSLSLSIRLIDHSPCLRLCPALLSNFAPSLVLAQG